VVPDLKGHNPQAFCLAELRVLAVRLQNGTPECTAHSNRMKMKSRFPPMPYSNISETTTPAMRVGNLSGGRKSPGSGCAECAILVRVLDLRRKHEPV
jgi:hypothetical protein